MAAVAFGIVDYIVFVGLFLVSMAIGVYFGIRGRKRESTEEYLMGGRQLSLIPVSLSIVVSVMSSNGLMGSPAEMYTYGIMNVFSVISFLIACCIVAMVIVPLFHPLKLVSVNEYLERRFNSRAVRLLGCFIFLLNSILYIGTVIYGPAIALNTATGAPPWAAILLVAFVGTTYTSIGGMKAVIWTDVFQSLIMIGGLITVNVMGTLQVGSLSEVWRINDEWGRLVIDTGSELTKRWTFVAIFIGITNYWVATFGVNQPCVQRFCALETVNKGRIAVLLNGPGCVLMTVLSTMTGFVAFAYYTKKGCDPISSNILSSQNQIMPYFVLDVLSLPGLPGVFISSLFSACLSTLSSSINSMAAVTWEDVLKPHFNHWSPKKQATVTKVMAVVYGLVCMSVSYMVLGVGGNILQITISFFGATIGPTFGLFILGALIPWANWKGALAGGISGLTLLIWMMFGQIFMKLQRSSLPAPKERCDVINGWNVTMATTYTPTTQSLLPFDVTTEATELLSGLGYFYSISFAWFSLIGVVIVVVVGVAVSAMTGFDDPNECDTRLLFPCIRKYFQQSSVFPENEKEKEVMLQPFGNDKTKHENGEYTKLNAVDS